MRVTVPLCVPVCVSAGLDMDVHVCESLGAPMGLGLP